MKSKFAYKVTGILATLSAVAALSATAQTTSQTTTQTTAQPPVSQQPVPTLPATQLPDSTAAQAPVPAPPPGTTTTTTTTTQVAADPNAPKAFVQQAYLANEFGIAASQVALQQSTSPKTKKAAQTVLNDGMKVRQDMITAIQGSTGDMHFQQDWTDEYKQKLADLQSAKGKAFDAKYLATQGEVTQKAASLFSDYAQTGTDAAVKTFAENTLPKLQADSDTLQAAATPSPATTRSSSKTTTHTTTGTR